MDYKLQKLQEQVEIVKKINESNIQNIVDEFFLDSDIEDEIKNVKIECDRLMQFLIDEIEMIKGDE